MKKKTKKALWIGKASAAVLAAGMLLSTTQAYADEGCNCTPEAHIIDCTCGCAEMAITLKDAGAMLYAANVDAVYAENNEAGTKAAAEIAASEAEKAKTAADAAKEKYDKVLSDETESVNKQQEQAAANEKEALDKLIQATVKEGQAAMQEKEEAQNAYDEAKRALDVANMLIPEEAESVKSAWTAYEEAKKEYEDKEKLAQENQAIYETDKEIAIKADQTYKEAKIKYDEALEAFESAKKLCNEHIAERIAKEVTVSIAFKTKDGENISDAVRTEIYIDEEYTESGAFGLPATIVSTDSLIRINIIGQTGGFDEFKLIKPNDGENINEGVYLKFIKTKEDGQDKETLKAFLTDYTGKIISGDWFVINGADLQTGEVELVFLMERIRNDELESDPKPSATDAASPGVPIQPTYRTSWSDDRTTHRSAAGDVSSVKDAAAKIEPKNNSRAVASATPSGSANATTAAATGDKGYAQSAGYTLIAAAALAGAGLAIKRRKS